MSNFISVFKKTYCQIEKKESGQISIEFIHKKLIDLLENNATDKLDETNSNRVQKFEQNILLIANALMSQSMDKNEESSKEILLKKLFEGKGINVGKEANKFKKFVNKDVYDLRKKIIDFIRNNMGMSIIIFDEREEILDENSFYKYLSQWKEYICHFFSEYKITKKFVNANIYDDILNNYQSFNFQSLSNLMKYFEKFQYFYKIYRHYENILNILKKINNILNNNMKNEEIISKHINNVFLGFEDCSFKLSWIFNELNKKIENISSKVEMNTQEIEKLKMDNEKIKLDNERLKLDNENLSKKVETLETNYQSFEEALNCPISHKIINSPVIIPYGFSYDENKIKEWLKHKNTDPCCNNPLNENQLIRNRKLADLIEVYKVGKEKKEKNEK